MPSSEAIYDTVVDEDAPGLPISVPDSGDTGEGGRLKMIVQLVRNALGVKDLAAMYVLVSYNKGILDRGILGVSRCRLR